jgi:hypothetical protein
VDPRRTDNPRGEAIRGRFSFLEDALFGPEGKIETLINTFSMDGNWREEG